MNLSEHKFIEQLIVIRWWSDVERLVHPLENQARECFKNKQFLEGCNFQKQARAMSQKLLEERRASEDRIYWLQLDTQLRLEGKTYPDVYEAAENDQTIQIPGLLD